MSDTEKPLRVANQGVPPDTFSKRPWTEPREKPARETDDINKCPVCEQDALCPDCLHDHGCDVPL